MAEAHTLNCLMCGAPARSDASSCGHCGARLATVACPSCFGMIFQGSRFCPLCGVRADHQAVQETTLPCPHCKTHLTRVTVGKAILSECPKCEGFWIDTLSFETITTEREQQAAILGTAVILPPVETLGKVRYIKCPECAQLMQRVNFAGCSGVVIDICRQHGTWFDAKELQRIIQFIRAGGMERSRQKQISELEATKRRVAADRAREPWQSADYSSSHRGYDGVDVADVVLAAGGLLFHLLKR